MTKNRSLSWLSGLLAVLMVLTLFSGIALAESEYWYFKDTEAQGGVYGGTVTVNTTLLDSDNIPVVGVDVVITLGTTGVSDTVTTDANGYAEATFSGDQRIGAGVHNVYVRANDGALQATATLIVDRREINISMDSQEKVSRYDPITPTATIDGLLAGEDFDVTYSFRNLSGVCYIDAITIVANESGANPINYEVKTKTSGILTLPSGAKCVAVESPKFKSLALGGGSELVYGGRWTPVAQVYDPDDKPIKDASVTFTLGSVTATVATDENGMAILAWEHLRDFGPGEQTIAVSAMVESVTITGTIEFELQKRPLTIRVDNKTKVNRYDAVTFTATLVGLVPGDELKLTFDVTEFEGVCYIVADTVAPVGDTNLGNYDMDVEPGELGLPSVAPCVAKETRPGSDNASPPPPPPATTPSKPEQPEPTDLPDASPPSDWAVEALDVVRNNTNLAEFFGENAPKEVGGTELGTIIASLASLHGLEDVPFVQPSSTTPDGDDSGPVTRGQAAKALYDLLFALRPEVALMEDQEHLWLDDMDDDMLAVINALADLGIVNGYPDGTFRPDALVSREEMATLLARLLALLGQQ